jgi:phosphomannomutase
MGCNIVFGTDGWRGVIAEDFTFANVEKVALAAARYFKQEAKRLKRRPMIVVGYDARFLSKEFAERTAQVAASNGVKVKLADKISATPMVSLMARNLQCAGGVVITASHNPPRYNGFKLKGHFGGPTHPEGIALLEKHLAKIVKKKSIASPQPIHNLVSKKTVEYIDMTELYVRDIERKINVKRINDSGIRIMHDAMHGAGMDVLTTLIPSVQQMHAVYNPSFGGVNPEPLEKNLTQLISTVRSYGYHIGIATDGDADRVGAVDEKGNYIDPHRMFSLLLKYLVEYKGWNGEVAKSFTVSDIVDKQCKRYGLKLHTTPVGFKYICRLMTERDILIGGEESGGLGVKGHIPERDGVYVGLLLCEMIIERQKMLSDLVKELMDEFGERHYRRIDHHITPKEKTSIMKKFTASMKTIAGYPVRNVETIDGFKYYVDNGWLLVRPSGTEPLIRFYAEADSVEKAEKMLKAAME